MKTTGYSFLCILTAPNQKKNTSSGIYAQQIDLKEQSN